MSKQRPSNRRGRTPDPPAGSGGSLGVWLKRVFRNTYTRHGRRMQVRGWAVKIQHQGRRKTFSLASGTRAGAAQEARRIHGMIVTRGWDEASFSHATEAARGGDPNPIGIAPRTGLGHWKSRLIRRNLPLPEAPPELSVRIEHAGMAGFFPLGTLDEDLAAGRARQIHHVIAGKGWETACRKFARELTLAIHWAENPLAWTYATIRAAPEQDQTAPARPPVSGGRIIPVALVEPDAGVRRAVAGCIDSQPGFACAAAFSCAREAVRMIQRGSCKLVLANPILPDSVPGGVATRLREAAPGIPVLFLSVHEDSDHLFRTTPGGVSGYLLKRTRPDRLLEPLDQAIPEGRLSSERIAESVQRYFRRVITSLAAGQESSDLSKLTHREHEILNLLSRGHVDKEIAEGLRISVWTVHGHLKKIFDKLGVHTRTEAAIRYLHK